jgi:integrase
MKGGREGLSMATRRATKSKKFPGVYSFKGKKRTTYGIDYIHPQTSARVRKILKNITSEAKAAEIRAIELADAARGAINKAYGLKAKAVLVSFEAMTKAFLEWAKQNPDRKSWRTDEHNAKPLLRAFKGKLMSDITPWMVEKFKVARIKEVSKRTVNNEIVLGSQVYKKAAEWKRYMGENPFLKAGRFRIDKGKKPGALSPEQAEAVISAIQHPVKRDMVAFAYYAGWRVSEIRKLRWEDLNLEAGLAWIVDPKNKETVEIELGDMALEIVRRQERRSEFVFCHKNGKAYKTNLGDVVKNAASRAGVALPPRKRWHIFRRTWASMMLQAGCDVETLRVLGNWKDHTMPLWYAEAAGRRQRRAALNRVPVLNGRNLPEMEKGEKTSV